jgi:acetyl-CoA synthetase
MSARRSLRAKSRFSRRLRDIAAGKETVGDTSTLEDYSVLAKIREEEE